MKHSIFTLFIFVFLSLVFLADHGQCISQGKSPPIPIVIEMRLSGSSELKFAINERSFSLVELKEWMTGIYNKFGNSDLIVVLPSNNVTYAQLIEFIGMEPFSRNPLLVVSINDKKKLMYFCPMTKDNKAAEKLRNRFLELFEDSGDMLPISTRLLEQLEKLYSKE